MHFCRYQRECLCHVWRHAVVTSAIDKEKPQRLQLEEQDRGLKTCLRPRSHVPVFERPASDRTGESTTWNFITSPVLTGRSYDQHAVTKQSCMHSDLQWIVIQLLLCSCCTVVVNVDVTGCIWFIQKFRKKKKRGRIRCFLHTIW